MAKRAKLDTTKFELEMRKFFEENQAMQFRHKQLGDTNFFISNQKPVSSDPDGRRKFLTGLDTIWLFRRSGNGITTPIAKMAEQKGGGWEFQNIALEIYADQIPV